MSKEVAVAKSAIFPLPTEAERPASRAQLLAPIVQGLFSLPAIAIEDNEPAGPRRVLLELLRQADGALAIGDVSQHVSLAHAGETLAAQACLGVDLADQSAVCVLAPTTREWTRADRKMLEDLVVNASSLFEDLDRTRQACTEAQRLSGCKDGFLAALSHELRTPLNAMLGWSQILVEGPIDPNLYSRGLATIERQARLQAQLIDDILDLSRAVAGKLRLQLLDVNLPQIVTEAVDAVRPLALGKQITLVLDARESAWESQIVGDADRLHQVIWNLLTNAIKFTPREGRIDVTVEASGSDQVVRVRDSGRGISVEFLPHVFDRFRQENESSGTGLGLGLFIAGQIVELHQGRVTAESAGIGHGATFTVRLPVRNDSAQPALPLPHSQFDEQPTSVDGLEGVSILLIEDEPDSSEVLRMVLEGRGAEVRAAGTGEKALALAEHWRPDVILSDYELPDRNGCDLLRDLRARGLNAPAVVISASAMEEETRRFLQAGFQLHVPKPIEPAALVTTVARLTSWTR
jgi:signal transduction histidine kinase/CheY-like chemotaxis protein